MAAKRQDVTTVGEETMDLEKAAAFLNMSPEALRRKTKEGLVPGCKPAKSWVFLKSDLVAYLRARYAHPWQASQSGPMEAVCHSSDVVKPGGSRIPIPQESEYAALLGLQTGGKLSNITTS